MSFIDMAFSLVKEAAMGDDVESFSRWKLEVVVNGRGVVVLLTKSAVWFVCERCLSMSVFIWGNDLRSVLESF